MKQLAFILMWIPVLLIGSNQSNVDSLKNLLPKVKNKDKLEVLQELAKQYYELSSDTCLIFAEQALELAEQLDEYGQKAKSYTRIGDFYDRKKNNYPLSISYQDSALTYYLKDKDYYNATKTQILIADLYDLISDYQNALEYLNYAQNSCGTLLQTYPDTKAIKLMLSDIFTGRGVIYKKFDSLSLSREYINKALEYSLEIEDSLTIAGAYCNIAQIYQSERKIDLAVNEYKIAAKYMHLIGYEEHQASIYNNIGGMLEYQGKVDSALYYFNKAEPLFKKTGNKYNLSILYSCFGTTYLNMKQYGKAEAYYLKAKKVAAEINADNLVFSHDNMLSEIFLKQRDYKKALEYYKKYTELKDSIVGQEAMENISNLRIKFDTEKKEKENQKLKHDIELNEITIKQKSKMNRVYAVIVLLVLAFLLYIFILFRKKSKSYDALVKQNIKSLEIEQKLEQSLALPIESTIEDQTESGGKLSELNKKLSKFMLDEKPFLWKDVNMEEFCQKLSTNRTYLSKLINERYKQSFQDYICENRIRTARVLLADHKNKHLSIEGIGDMSGFKTNASFHKRFKEFVQLTPKQFRDRVKKTTE